MQVRVHVQSIHTIRTILMPFWREECTCRICGPDSEQEGGLMNHFVVIILSYLPALQCQRRILQTEQGLARACLLCLGDAKRIWHRHQRQYTINLLGGGCKSLHLKIKTAFNHCHRIPQVS